MDITVVCSDCGKDLDESSIDMASYCTVRIHADICEGCLEAAREEAFADGKEEAEQEAKGVEPQQP